MLQFTNPIETEEGTLNFYFNPLGNHYHVSTVNKNGKVIIFHMHQKDGKWRILLNNPDAFWFLKIEPKLSDMIFEHILVNEFKVLQKKVK